jgi:hypothetical protein
LPASTTQKAATVLAKLPPIKLARCMARRVAVLPRWWTKSADGPVAEASGHAVNGHAIGYQCVFECDAGFEPALSQTRLPRI